ncbi:uncharacterized protein LOC111919786 [Lactuca sativa]|uniref:uncharacterized protein LOC111919786 n=1 Tax=Lactuca sativa TaxID=4236 RepID=UPI001C68CA23|nr:uncharacterized protein LOC111919786 [Lactuca sativa]
MSTQTFQTETRASIKNLEQQMSQLATSVGRLESQGKLPGHTENNPKHNVSAIFLKNGKTYEGPSSSEPENKDEAEFEEVLIEEGDVEGIEKETEVEEFKEVFVEEESEKLEEKETPTLPKPILKEYKPLPPFPSRPKSTKRERDDEDIMKILHKVEVNISLLDVIKHIPRYAKFLKNLCISMKKKMKFNEIVKAGKNISSIFQKGLPPKCKDLGIFLVPCKLGNLDFSKAMLDLGASVIVLPYFVFEKLKMGTLQKTRTIIQLADHSAIHPKGVLEDVLVQVDKLIFPADFYILDMGNLDTSDTNSIILGRPFMKTAKTKIDVFNGMIPIEFDEEVVKFQINNVDFPSENISVSYMGTNRPLLEGWCEFSNIYVQENFQDRNSSDSISKELAEDKLGEVEEVEMKSATEEESNKNLIRKMFLDKEKVGDVFSYMNLKRRKFKESEGLI